MVNDMDEHLHKILDKHFERIRKVALNANIGDEITNGIKTGRRAIVAYVSKKKKLGELKKEERLPDMIEGVPVDVVELSSDDYELGDTAPSHLKPKEQKRIASGVKKNGES
jgi:hypothetical protein